MSLSKRVSRAAEDVFNPPTGPVSRITRDVSRWGEDIKSSVSQSISKTSNQIKQHLVEKHEKQVKDNQIEKRDALRKLQINRFHEIDNCLRTLESTEPHFGLTTLVTGFSGVLFCAASFFAENRNTFIFSGLSLLGFSTYNYVENNGSIGGILPERKLIRLQTVANQLGDYLSRYSTVKDAVDFFKNLKSAEIIKSLKQLCQEYQDHLRPKVAKLLNKMRTHTMTHYDLGCELKLDCSAPDDKLLISKANHINQLLSILNRSTVSKELIIKEFIEKIKQSNLRSDLCQNRSSFFKAEKTQGAALLENLETVIRESNANDIERPITMHSLSVKTF